MAKPFPPEIQAARFWAKVDKSAGAEGCWLYMGFRKWDGYGWLARCVGGKTRYLTAHRYAWMLTHGEPAKGLHILHRCDNPPCCNPSHLWLGTAAENHEDKRTKGRAVGSRHMAKLTEEQVAAIRTEFRPHKWGCKDELAAKYGVAVATIGAIVSGRTWNCPAPVKLHPNRVRPRRQTA